MRKKVLSLALALAMCLGLTVPALAAEKPKDAKEAFQNVSLRYPLGNGVDGTFDFGISVEKPWTQFYQDWIEEDGKEVTHAMDGYLVMRKNTVFTLTNSDPAGSTSFMRIYLTTYTNRGNNRYEHEAWPHREYLTRKDGFLSDECDPDDAGGLVELTGGQSFQFTLPDAGADVIYELEIEKYYPEFEHETTDEAGNTYPVTPYWYRYLYLKVDEAAVDQGLKDLGDAGTSPEPAAPAAGNRFTDVADSSPYKDAILWAVEKEITSGTTKTTFSPNTNCSTAQILTFLWRANGSPKPAKSNPFTDVKSGEYFTDAAVWAHEKGLVSGTAFGGSTPCTRAMAVTYLWKAAGSPSAKAASFTDVPADADYANAVAWAVEQGVTAGTSDTTFSPDKVCTRGQIVTFLHRASA